jgi:hypothetical protein
MPSHSIGSRGSYKDARHQCAFRLSFLGAYVDSAKYKQLADYENAAWRTSHRGFFDCKKTVGLCVPTQMK